MKKIVLLTALIAANTVSAAENEARFSELRKAGVFLGSAITGGVLAGPVGMVVAAGSGVWLDEQVVKVKELESVKAELAQSDNDLSILTDKLASIESLVDKSSDSSLEQLELELLFKTGSSELTEYGTNRLLLLEEYLLENNDLRVRLDGFADPRGDAEYNKLLSKDRVVEVAEHLRNAGIESNRIDYYSHGAEKSVAKEGDIDSYAFERVVRIQLLHEENDDSVLSDQIAQIEGQ